MTWSYDATDLDTETDSGRLNSVRYLVGDTQSIDEQVQDEEIGFALAQTSNSVYNAAAFVASTIASKYSRLVTTQLDGALSADYSDLAKSYRILATELKGLGQKYSSSSLGMFTGGVLLSEINVVRSNTNRVSSSFRMDRFRIDTVQYESDYVEE
tara:strand:- start:1690 stop:2154 length:465 start_codon:yes stop_codon:yes gene_type:complete